MINVIVAMSQNRVIGRDNQLPWKIKEDMARFKQLTTGNVVVMGRKTYESIGKALPNRINIVLSKDENFNPKDAIIFNDTEKCIEFCKKLKGIDVFIIGGQQIYEQTLKYAQRLYITQIKEEIEGDAYFPDFLNSNKDIDIFLDWIFTGKKHKCNESGLEYEFLVGELHKTPIEKRDYTHLHGN